jgi:hypothetical protein
VNDGQIDAQAAVNRLAARVGMQQLELELAHDAIAARDAVIADLRQQLADAHDAEGDEPK